MSEMIVPQKQCTKCHEWKPATPEHFYRHKKSPDGLYPQCKACKDAYRKTPEGRDVVKRKVEKWRKTESGKAWVRAKFQRRDSENDPARHAAHNSVRNAVQRGKLQPIGNCKCAMCNRQAEEYHHWSYAPEHRLNVIPLCQPCHANLHRMRMELKSMIEGLLVTENYPQST